LVQRYFKALEGLVFMLKDFTRFNKSNVNNNSYNYL